MTDRELMQQALDALEFLYGWTPDTDPVVDASITAMRERLAQPQMQPCAGRNCGSTNPNLHSAECFEDYEKATGMAQPEPKPVAWKDKTYGNLHHQDFGNSIPLYTAPPQREWQGLTDDEILQTLDLVAYDTQAFDFAYRIETKLREKNT